MKFEIKENEVYIFNVIKSAAAELSVPAYIVGGFVRDRLLNRKTKDIDIVCVGSGIDLAHKVAEKLSPKPKVAFFKNFGTASLLWKGFEVEFVGARRESYQRDSRKPIVEDGTLEDDQNRRDFTINALAVSLNEGDFGALIDPHGGLVHLEEKLIKTPLDPDITFSDDPLRMMRAIRFSTQLDFRIDEVCLNSIRQQADRLRIISQERITVEFEKILAAPKPSIGLKLLFETGLLQKFFAEMCALQGVQTEGGYQHKDNFFHTLKVIDNICLKTDNIWLRWSALLHDIGKPIVKKYDKELGWTFHGHDAVGANMVPRIFKRLKLPLDHSMKYVQNLVRLHQRPIHLTKEDISDSAVRRILFDAGEDIDDLMTLCRADITSRNPDRVKRYMENYDFLMERMKEVESKDQLRNWQPPITGEMIMETFNIPPCKLVGDIKTVIREAILDGEIANNYEEAFAFMMLKAKELGVK